MSRGRRLPGLLVALLATMALAAPARAYDPITWYSVDGGGTSRAAAGGYTLGGTIGQPDAGVLASGATTLRGGFWIGGVAGAVGVAEGAPGVRAFGFFAPRPNPVRSASRVAFDLPRASRVALSVFDISGRAVRRQDFGPMPAGHHERVWNAVDETGRPIANGVYFLRLETDRERGVRKVLVLR